VGIPISRVECYSCDWSPVSSQFKSEGNSDVSNIIITCNTLSLCIYQPFRWSWNPVCRQSCLPSGPCNQQTMNYTSLHRQSNVLTGHSTNTCTYVPPSTTSFCISDNFISKSITYSGHTVSAHPHTHTHPHIHTYTPQQNPGHNDRGSHSCRYTDMSVHLQAYLLLQSNNRSPFLF